MQEAWRDLAKEADAYNTTSNSSTNNRSSNATIYTRDHHIDNMSQQPSIATTFTQSDDNLMMEEEEEVNADDDLEAMYGRPPPMPAGSSMAIGGNNDNNGGWSTAESRNGWELLKTSARQILTGQHNHQVGPDDSADDHTSNVPPPPLPPPAPLAGGRKKTSTLEFDGDYHQNILGSLATSANSLPPVKPCGPPPPPSIPKPTPMTRRKTSQLEYDGDFHTNPLGDLATSSQGRHRMRGGGSGGVTKNSYSCCSKEDNYVPSPLENIMIFGCNVSTLVVCMVLLFLSWFVPSRVLQSSEFSIFADMLDPSIRFKVIAASSTVVPTWIFVVWAGRRVIPATTGDCKPCKGTSFRDKLPSAPGQPVVLLLIGITIKVADAIVQYGDVILEEYQEVMVFIIRRALAFTMTAFWISLMDAMVQGVNGYADQTEEIAKASPLYKTGRKWLRDMSKFKDHDIDKAYATPGGSRSPARVLAEVVGIYATIGKALGFAFLALFLLGVDLYSNLVTFGLSALGLTIINALHIDNALKNLLPLAMSNVLHLGEIVCLTKWTTPGDNPETHVTGFVEGMTWSHVVIRDFQRKQVFISHSQMAEFNVFNWSRRPNKVVRLSVHITGTHGGGALKIGTLTRFLQKWIKSNPKIDTDLYQKIKCRLQDDGSTMMVIHFYPKRGTKSSVMKAEVTHVVLEAAERLNLCLIPTLYRPTDIWNIDPTTTTANTTAATRTAEPPLPPPPRPAASATIVTTSSSRQPEEETTTTTSTAETVGLDQDYEYDDADIISGMSDLLASDNLTKRAGYNAKKNTVDSVTAKSKAD